jgi:hypothetical protein
MPGEKAVMPGLWRASTSYRIGESDVDGRDKPGHDKYP